MRKIVGLAIDETLAAYPTLMSSVKSLTIGPIFDKKRAETELYLTQFLAMEKESVDTMAVEVPLPAEINSWNSWRDPTGSATGTVGMFGTINRIPPVMHSALMGHLRYLSTELYPLALTMKFETSISSDSQKVRAGTCKSYLSVNKGEWLKELGRRFSHVSFFSCHPFEPSHDFQNATEC